MAIEWWRGRDNYGRLHTFAISDGTATHYLPDEGGFDFELSDARIFRPGHPPAQVRSFSQPVRTVRLTGSAANILETCREFGINELVPSKLRPGDYFGRMWRDGESPDLRWDLTLMDARASTIRYSRVLYRGFRDLMRYVEPDRAHDGVYSHEIRQLLLLACTEVESAWRSILSWHWGFEDDERLTTKTYVGLGRAMRLGEWAVTLSTHRLYGYIIPFKDWDPLRPSASLPWYDAYNQTKHDREGKLKHATFGHLVDAMAAVFVMTVAQFGTEHLESEEFHVDEFRVERSPSFGLEELYIRPLAPPGSDKAKDWFPVHNPDV
jgi:hypothetical protein